MKAEQWLKENVELNDWNGLEENLNDSLWTNNVVRYMEEYAKQFQLIGICVFCDSDDLHIINGIARCNGCGQVLNYTKTKIK